MGIFKNNQVEYDDEINVFRELVKTALYVIAIIVIVVLVLKYVGSRCEVIGHSMENTLHDGESVWLNKWTYRFKNPERYDIVIFPYNDSDTFFIKRVIGLPGETIYIDENGSIFVGESDEIYEAEDGEIITTVSPLTDGYGIERIDADNRGIAEEPYRLGGNEYFVLGDNRNNSQDSRMVGPIPRNIIKGKTNLRLWPLNKFGTIDKQEKLAR